MPLPNLSKYLLTLGLIWCAAARAETYYVNAVALTDSMVDQLETRYGIRLADAAPSEADARALQRIYGVRVAGNRFWYDAVSGAWGYDGLPAAGQIAPFLRIGGPIRADASGGETRVAVNGRWLHPSELRYLNQRFGSVAPGYYYLFANGAYGVVGGPILGNLKAGGGGSSSLSGRDKFGSVMGSGNFSGYLPSGSGGVGVTCAPDGGCIYD